MPVTAYRARPFRTTHENRVFDGLLSRLVQVWGNSDEYIVLLGNFYCNNSEIDAAVIKRDSVSVIDFKNYGGVITFSENGTWFAGADQIRAGSKLNPFQQLRDNKFSMIESLEKAAPPHPGMTRSWGHVSALVVFHDTITFDESQLPSKLAPWFHVVDLDHAVERLSQITSREINLSASDIDAIVTALQIPKYVSVGAVSNGRQNAQSSTVQDDGAVPAPLRSAVESIGAFVDSPDRILVIKTMEGPDATRLMELARDMLLRRKREYLLLAPNSRTASRYPDGAESIYSHIYSRETHKEKNYLVHRLKKNCDAQDQIYIVGNAHLISDSLFEPDVVRWGSGRILGDFVKFVGLDALESRNLAEIDEAPNERKIIFVGDEYQLSRGKPEETALSPGWFYGITQSEAREISVDPAMDAKRYGLSFANRIALAECIRNQRFNRLSLEVDGDQVVEITADDPDIRQAAFEQLQRETSAKFIADTNSDVNMLNTKIREAVFGRTGSLQVGDLVHFHNSFYADDRSSLHEKHLVTAGSFGEVLEVDDNVISIKQPLQGRAEPIEVRLLKVKARLAGVNTGISFFCLRDYLYADNPKLDSDTLIALRVSSESRFRNSLSRSPVPGIVTGEPNKGSSGDERDPTRDHAWVEFLRSDPLSNVARLRFGYALTIYRAQGNPLDTIIADLNTVKEHSSEKFFRWLYTMFVVAQNQVTLLNVPEITPLCKAAWVDSDPAIVFGLRPGDLIPYDPRADEDVADDTPFPTEQKELRNLCRYIARNVSSHGFRVTSLEHQQYAEIYRFEGSSGGHCVLKLTYKKNFRVSDIRTVTSNPPGIGSEIEQMIRTGVRFDSDIQRQIYEVVSEKLISIDMIINSIEHHDYDEIYYVQSQAGDVKMKLVYNGSGFVTRVSPIAVTNQDALETIRKALKL